MPTTAIGLVTETETPQPIPVPRVRHVASGGVSGTSVTIPAGLAAGDVVLMIARKNASNIALPSGFTQIAQGQANAGNYYVYGWKRATASDTGTWTLTASAAVAYSIWRNTGDPSFTAVTTSNVLTNTSVTLPATTGKANGAMVVRLLGTASNADPTPGTFTDGTTRISQRSTNWACAIASQPAVAGGTAATTSNFGLSDYVYSTVTLTPLIGQASETDASLGVTRHFLTATLGQPSTADTAQPMTRISRRTLGQPVETDSTFSLRRPLRLLSETNYARKLLRMRGTKVSGPVSFTYYSGTTDTCTYQPDSSYATTMWGDGSDTTYVQYNHTDNYWATRYWATFHPAATAGTTTVKVRAKCSAYGTAKTSIDLMVTARRTTDFVTYDDITLGSFTAAGGFLDFTGQLDQYGDTAAITAALAAGQLEIWVWAQQNGGTLGDDWSIQVSEASLVGTTPWAPNLASSGPVTEADTTWPVKALKSLKYPEELDEVFGLTIQAPFNNSFANRLELDTADGPGVYAMSYITQASTEAGEYLGSDTATLWYAWTGPVENVPAAVSFSFSYAGQSGAGGAAIRVYTDPGTGIPGVSDLIDSDSHTGASGTVSATVTGPTSGYYALIQVGLYEKTGTVSGLTVSYDWSNYDPSTGAGFFTPVIPSL